MLKHEGLEELRDAPSANPAGVVRPEIERLLALDDGALGGRAIRVQTTTNDEHDTRLAELAFRLEELGEHEAPAPPTDARRASTSHPPGRRGWWAIAGLAGGPEEATTFGLDPAVWKVWGTAAQTRRTRRRSSTSRAAHCSSTRPAKRRVWKAKHLPSGSPSQAPGTSGYGSIREPLRPSNEPRSTGGNAKGRAGPLSPDAG